MNGRRNFLKTVALAGGAAQAAQEQAAPGSGAATGGPAAAPGIGYPRTFSGRRLAMIAFPLGGVGAGSISLGGRGQLRDWEIFNKPDKGRAPAYSFPAIWVQAGKKAPVTRVLEARLNPPFQGASGLKPETVAGLPRLESATFTGEFPWLGSTSGTLSCPSGFGWKPFRPLFLTRRMTPACRWPSCDTTFAIRDRRGRRRRLSSRWTTPWVPPAPRGR